ncbi:MAG TPA: hypothetical protein PKB07_24895, partial [Flavilitoribacter sp.]|nr:hypothetical protein [Flavilitoribacter sp.]
MVAVLVAVEQAGVELPVIGAEHVFYDQGALVIHEEVVGFYFFHQGISGSIPAVELHAAEVQAFF